MREVYLQDVYSVYTVIVLSPRITSRPYPSSSTSTSTSSSAPNFVFLLRSPVTFPLFSGPAFFQRHHHLSAARAVTSNIGLLFSEVSAAQNSALGCRPPVEGGKQPLQCAQLPERRREKGNPSAASVPAAGPITPVWAIPPPSVDLYYRSHLWVQKLRACAGAVSDCIVCPIDMMAVC